MAEERTTSYRNRFLAGMAAREMDIVGPRLEEVQLELGTVLYEPRQPLTHVWFPHNALISLVSCLESGQTVEVALVGSEGIAGLHLLLGATFEPYRAIVQGPGHAHRMRADVLRKIISSENGHAAITPQLMRYTHSFLTQVAQTAACNRVHPLERRLARWLLMAHDRLQSDVLLFTQEFLAYMLGTRRAGVNAAVGALVAAGVIQHTRGKIFIVDRPGLERMSCECYKIARTETDQVWSTAPR